MKVITDFNNKEAEKFFLKKTSYINFDIPTYFVFNNLLNEISKKIGNNLKIENYLSTYKNEKNKLKNNYPGNFENVNYSFLDNKDGNYEWRPLEIINPFLYVFLVKIITNKNNWLIINKRFKCFKENNIIECISIPGETETKNKDKGDQILNWWTNFEQQSIILGLDYKFLFESDITNCYSSIYVHSISWAIHGKKIVKENILKGKNKGTLGDEIEKIIMGMSNQQTNGIPQGSVLMDFIAELVLGYADLLLTEKLKKFNKNQFKILRYRDDYKIFTNSQKIGEEILKTLTEVLIELGLKLSKGKTKFSDDIIKSSIKEDKYHLLQNITFNKSLSKELFFIKSFSDKYKNSGSLIKLLNDFYKKISLKKEIKDNTLVLISIIVNIMLKNPRIYSLATAIISILILKVENYSSREEIIKKILIKFKNIPNTGHLEIWLQRVLLTLGNKKEKNKLLEFLYIFSKKVNYSFLNILLNKLNINLVYLDFNEKLCKKVNNVELLIWNNKFLNKEINIIFGNNNIIDYDEISRLGPKIEKEEFSPFNSNYY